jgi:CRP-like cAMP-binding protein
VISEAAAICEFLRRVPLFSGLMPNTLTEVADQMTLEHYAPGNVVLRQGDPGDKFYLIRRGEAEVLARRDGADHPVAVLDEGRFFGEQALITGEPRNATVRAKTELELCSLNKDEFHKVMNSSATFQEELRKVLFERQV